jgi:hypothetical protein
MYWMEELPLIFRFYDLTHWLGVIFFTEVRKTKVRDKFKRNKSKALCWTY